MTALGLNKQQLRFNASSNTSDIMSKHTTSSKLANFINLQSNHFNESKASIMSNKTSIPSISSYNSKHSSLNDNITQMKKTILFSLKDSNKDNMTSISQCFYKRINAIAFNNKTELIYRIENSISQYQNKTNKKTNSKSSKGNKFLNRSQELIDLIKKPSNSKLNNKKSRMNSLANKKQSQYPNSPNKNVYGMNIHEDFFDVTCLNKSASFQKLNHMKKVLTKETNNSNTKANNNNCSNIISICNDDEYKNKGRKELFKPSFQRKLKNKMNDLKKFEFFIDYQERKENGEKRAEFISNNLTIIRNIKEKVNKELPSEEEEEIDIKELIE